MKTNKILYALIFMISCGIFYFAMSYEHIPHVTVAAIQPGQDLSEYHHDYTLIYQQPKKIADKIMTMVKKNKYDPAIIPIINDVSIVYDQNNNKIYFKSTKEDFDSIVYSGIKPLDIFQPKVYIEAFLVQMSNEGFNKLPFHEPEKQENQMVKLNKKFNTYNHIKNYAQKILHKNYLVIQSDKAFYIPYNNNQSFLKVLPEVINKDVLRLKLYPENTQDSFELSNIKSKETVVIKDNSQSDTTKLLTYIRPTIITNPTSYEQAKKKVLKKKKKTIKKS